MRYKILKFVKSNFLFAFFISLAIVFIISPILLRVPMLKNGLLLLIEPLGQYKSSYIETIGAILGTFLAITGALWTQKRTDLKNEKKEQYKSVKIIYHNFYRASLTISKFVDKLIRSEEDYINTIDEDNLALFIKRKNEIKLYTSDEWLSNLTVVMPLLSKSEADDILELYFNFCRIKDIVEKDADELNLIEANEVFTLIINDVCHIEYETVSGFHVCLNDKIIKVLATLDLLTIKLDLE